MIKKGKMRASAPKINLRREVNESFLAGSPAVTLGPLEELPGTWVGKGFNIVSLPDFQGGTKFRVMVNSTIETFTFKEIGGPIPNRGNIQPDIFFLGLQYLQEVTDAETMEGIHLEPGLFIFLPKNDVQKTESVVRMSTIPHGDSVLAQGPAFTVNGGPIIDKTDSLPFTVDPNTGARINDSSTPYLLPFQQTPLPAGIPEGSILDPNNVLLKANQDLIDSGKKIVKTIVFQVDAAPVGGINGTPLKPSPGSTGGIVNIPFVVSNANANSMSAIFWIEFVQDSDGSQFLQLQYTQTVILDFPVKGPDGKMVDIKWPHISVATLIKR